MTTARLPIRLVLCQVRGLAARAARWLAILLSTGALSGCYLTALPGKAQAPPVSVRFKDVTQAAGIRFVHHNGAAGKKLFPETVGSGCAFIDYDNDGWEDILLIDSKSMGPPAP